MPNYMLAYHGGKTPESPEEGEVHMAKWKAWAEELGNSLVNKGTPLGDSKTVSSSGVTDGGGKNPLIGYSILKAENIDAAVKLVKNCPHIHFGGTMVVAEMMEMPSS